MAKLISEPCRSVRPCRRKPSASSAKRIAASVGLDEVRVKDVLSGNEYADAVEADIREAVSLGASGVPFYVIDRKYGVAGAQPSDVFSQVLERAWAESHPTLDLVGGADACGPDGCAI